jgi:hypothetical protein
MTATNTLYQAEELWHHIYGDERGILAISYKKRAKVFKYPHLCIKLCR